MLLGTGCTRVVDVSVDEGPTLLVVEGRIELGDSLQRVRLTTTDLFSSPNLPPAVTDATVRITDDEGLRSGFAPDPLDPGVYVSRLRPLPGATYTLTIDYQGEHYQAVSTLVTGPPIDSLYFVYQDQGIAQGDSGFRAAIDYTDPAGVSNYYLWELYVDGVQRVKVDPGNRFRVISKDEFYDGGRVIGYQPFDEEVVDPGQQVLLRQVAISEDVYRYLFALYEQTQGGGPFSTPPASLRGNVANLTDPSHPALGYFFAGQVSERTATVPAR
jgi:Domain of unknown function (DUF4249)